MGWRLLAVALFALAMLAVNRGLWWLARYIGDFGSALLVAGFLGFCIAGIIAIFRPDFFSGRQRLLRRARQVAREK